MMQVSDWLMKGMVDEEEEDDIDSETGSMMRKISSPRSSNQVDRGYHADGDGDGDGDEVKVRVIILQNDNNCEAQNVQPTNICMKILTDNVPRCGNVLQCFQGDIRTMFRPFNMNTMDNVSILFADIVGFTR